MNQEKEAPNVVTEQRLRDLLRCGYRVEVLAEENAQKRHNAWYGLWIVRSVSSDGRDDKLLVVSGNSLRTRTFKTLNGLVSFLSDIGCERIAIGLCQGDRLVQQINFRESESKPNGMLDG